MVTFKVKYEDYIGGHKAFFLSYFKGFGINLNELEKREVAFVEIHIDDENENAAVIFENHNYQPLTGKIQDDWYSIKSTEFSIVGSA